MADYGVDISVRLQSKRMKEAGQSLDFKYPLVIASGIYSYPNVLYEACRHSIGGAVTKGVNRNGREGAETPCFHEVSPGVCINHMQLPNPGCRKFREEDLEPWYPKFMEIGRPLITQVFGETPDEVAEVTECLEPVCDAIELNASCPNKKEGDRYGLVIGVDPKLVEEFTAAVRARTDKPVAVKLSPAPYIFSPNLHKEIVLASIEGGADILSLINTVPGGMDIDMYLEDFMLSQKSGGVSGKAILPIGLGCVYATRQAAPDAPIMGIGGVHDAEDIVKYVMVGADAVGIGTACKDILTDQWKEWSEQLMDGVAGILGRKGRKALSELKGVMQK